MLSVPTFSLKASLPFELERCRRSMFSIKSFLWMSDDPRHVWVRDRLLETVSKMVENRSLTSAADRTRPYRHVLMFRFAPTRAGHMRACSRGYLRKCSHPTVCLRVPANGGVSFAAPQHLRRRLRTYLVVLFCQPALCLKCCHAAHAR
jgi:hypothetical protein